MLSMFRDEEFAMLLERYSPTHSGPQANLDEVRQEIKHLDAEIGALRYTHREAGFVLIQRRNFLARYIGDSEWRLWVSGDPDAAPEVDPIGSRHVAVFDSSGYEMVGSALRQTLKLFDRASRIQVYETPGSILDAVTLGNVLGMIGVHRDTRQSLEARLRHDLQHHPSIDANSAAFYPLPPCVDVAHPISVPRIIQIAHEMHGGRFRNGDAPFSLEAALPSLYGHMLMPGDTIRIAIVDDEEEPLAWMKIVLLAWPNVRADTINVLNRKPETMFSGLGERDIVALDENLGSGLTGTQVAEELRREHPHIILASTTGGSRPTFTDHHFHLKALIGKRFDVALAFVRFVNRLIQAHEARGGSDG